MGIFSSALKRKWISVNFNFSLDKDKVDTLKTKLFPYSKELDWEIIETEDQREANIWKIIPRIQSNVFLVPKIKSGTRNISPLEFKEIKKKLYLFAQQIAKDLGIEKINKSYMTSNIAFLNKFKGSFVFGQSLGFLVIKYNIKDRISLEKEDKKLSKYLFDGTVSELIEELSKDKENEWAQEVKKMISK